MGDPDLWSKLWRGQVAAVSNRLKDVIHSGWESDFRRVAYWHT